MGPVVPVADPAAPSARAGPWRLVFVVGVVLYPVMVWWGLSAGNPRTVAVVLLALAVPAAVVRLRGARAQAARSLMVVPLITVTALGLGAVLNRAGYVLAVPAAINLAMLAAFGATLVRGSTPMIERFARLQVAEPTAAQKAWCRMWTWIWCGFFVANGTVAAVLAWAAPVSWWALYNGLLAYVAMGALLGAEWLLRRRRFGAA